MRQYLHFEKIILCRGLSATWSFICEHLVIEGIFAIFAFAGGYIVAPFDNHAPLLQAFYISAGSAFCLIITVFLKSIFVAPYKMWKEQKLEIEKIKENLSQKNIPISDSRLAGPLKPLCIYTGTGKGFEEVIPSNGSFIQRYVYIMVRNENPFQFLSNCKLVMMLWHPDKKEDSYYTLEERFTLQPNEETFFKVASYKESTDTARCPSIELEYPVNGWATFENIIDFEKKYQMTFIASCKETSENSVVAILGVDQDGKLFLNKH